MTNFELGTRVPLIVAMPKQAAAGKRTQALVELVDLYPTLCEWCGLTSPSHLEGTSFAPLVDDPDRAWKTAAFSTYLRTGKDSATGRSIRTADRRYTVWTNAKGDVVGREFYDYANSPIEEANGVDDPRNKRAVAELNERLQAGWRAALPKP
jgi:arylsulfatase A-like enzyme